MQLGIINSAFVQAGLGTAYGIEQARAIGFDCIDIFADPLDIDGSERALIKTTAARCGLPIRSLCCVALGLTDFNTSVQRFHIDRCTAYLKLAAELGCDNLLLVLGEYLWQQEVIPPKAQWTTAVSNVQRLGDLAGECGIEIAIELEPFQTSLINSVSSMAALLDDVGRPEVVRANCDISHLHLMRAAPAELARLAGRISHVHLSDCNGKVHGDLPPGRGVVPIADYLVQLRQDGYDGTISIELEYPPENVDVIDWVTEAYREANRILRSIGWRRPSERTMQIADADY